MPTTARVTSIHAMTRFHGALRGFSSKARICVDDVSDDVRKVRQWLEHDRLPHWQHQIRERHKKLDAARQEFFTAQLSGVGADTHLQQAELNRAQRAVAEAERKLTVTRKWIREFDTVVGPVKRQLDKMDAIIIGLLPRAGARMNEMIKALESYAAINALPFEPAHRAGPRETTGPANPDSEEPLENIDPT
jgi:hypothetical protein